MGPTPPVAPGRLVVIRGCMFAGKTARLIALLAAVERAGRRIVALKHVCDTRYAPDRLATHDGRTYPAHAVTDVDAAADAAANADVIGLDEAQFFGPPLAGVCRGWRAGGRLVIVAGIHHDAWGRDFPPLPALAAEADDVETLAAPCGVCGAPAEFTQRMTPVVGGHLIGGVGDFEPRCAAHFRPLPPPAPRYA